MKKLPFFFLALSAALQAQHSSCIWPANSKKEPLNSLMTLGGNYTRVNFKPERHSDFDGNLGGAQVLYEYRPANAFYAGLLLQWRQGLMEGSDGGRFFIDLNGAERIGYTFVKNRFLTSLYTGFGFRYLGHHFHASNSGTSTFNGSFFPPFTSNTSPLRFSYYEFYFPLGFEMEYSFRSCFSLGLNFEWMGQAFTTLHINSLGGTFWKIKQKFLNFYGSMPLIFKLTKCGSWRLTINPFYEHWQDGETTAKTSGGTPLGIPGNNYNFYGVDLNLSFAF